MLAVKKPSKDLSGKLLPIHFRPEEDELLSSWICRLALAHGVNPSSLCSHVLPQRARPQEFKIDNVDTCTKSNFLTALAVKTNTPVERVVAATLPAYEGFLFERWNSHAGRAWILPVQSRRGKTRYGLQYCPLCLATGEPYYRRAWRLTIVTICSKHRVQLLDRCPKCASPISFHKAVWNGLHSPPSDRMTFCYSCKADLRKLRAKNTPQVGEGEILFQVSLETAIREGWIELPGTLSGYSLLFFPVLQHLLQLLTREGPGSALRRSLERQCAINMPAIRFMWEKRDLTQLSVGVRRGLMNLVRRLLTNWPDDFTSFCATHKIRSYHLSWRYTHIPFWYWSVINGHMRQPLYAPSKEEVESAVSYLKRLKSCYRRWPKPYPEEMKAVSNFLNTSSLLKRRMRKTSGVQVICRGDKSKRPKPLSGTLWKKVESLINSTSGRLIIDPNMRRKLLNGILYVLYTGCSWKTMPAKFGHHKSARSMYYQWKRTGLFERIWELCSDLNVK